MVRKIVSGIMSILLVLSMFTLLSCIQPVRAQGTIYINPDGSITPSTAPIYTADNITYTLTGNITADADGIVVGRNNIIVDGAGYTVQGTGADQSKGIHILGGESNIIIENTKIASFFYGIYFLWLIRSTLLDNTITNNWIGVWHSVSSYNTISGNNITANNNEGIQLYSSSSNTISGNNITPDNGNGIVAFNSSSNTISGNNITNNSYGLQIESSNYNSISGNNITNNDRAGIWLDSSSSNSILHNNFINNYAQVHSSDSVNVWNDGYPSGGNYWSDYNGTDIFCGAYQNQTGADGIGDTPNVIDANNTDHYPFMSPWGPNPTYVVTVNANAEGAELAVPITEDGSATGCTTPHEFDGLSGSHTFAVPSVDASGHPFLLWSTGQTSTTITVSSAGTYTAYYYEPGPTYFSVEPIAVPPLTDIDSSVNGLETPQTPSPVGRYFRVEIHLRNATATNVPNGVVGVEVHFNFDAVLPCAQVVNYTDMLGQSGGALNGPILYPIPVGFYNSTGGVSNPPYTDAVQYVVVAASGTEGGWNGADGLVAIIYFKIKGQPSFSQQDFIAPLYIPFFTLQDSYANYVPVSIAQGGLHIEAARVSLDNTQDIMVSNDSSANVSEIWNISTSPLADQWRALFFGDSIPPIQPGKVYGMPENRTVQPAISLEPGVTDNSLPGDIDGNGKVSLVDLVYLANAYGTNVSNSKPGTGLHQWNSACDLAPPWGVVGLSDLVTLALHYGKTRQPLPEIVEPVKEPFFASMVEEEAAWPGFQVNPLNATVIPWGIQNETTVMAEAYAPQVAVSMGTFWRIPFEPNDTIDMDAGFVLYQIQYLQNMLESLPYNTTYKYTGVVTFHLPAGASIMNAPELTGLNWTIDFGGGTVLNAYLSLSNSTVTVNELWTVTDQNITATEDYLVQAFYQYKHFNIDYSLGEATMSQTAKSEATGQSDWKHEYSMGWSLGPGPWEWKADWPGIHVGLKVTPKVDFAFYIGSSGHWFHTDWFETNFTVAPSITVYADAEVSAKTSGSLGPYALGCYSCPFSFMLGAVPVWGNAKMTVTANVTFNAEGTLGFTATYMLGSSLTTDIRWVRDSGWNGTCYYSRANSYSPPAIGGKASIDINPSVTARLELLFYNVAGPFVEVTPYAKIIIVYLGFVNPPTPSTWSIALMLKVETGVDCLGWKWSKELLDDPLDAWSGTW